MSVYCLLPMTSHPGPAVARVWEGNTYINSCSPKMLGRKGIQLGIYISHIIKIKKSVHLTITVT